MEQKLLACRRSICLRSGAKILVVGPSRLNELPEVRFEFPFNPVGKSTVELGLAHEKFGFWIGPKALLAS